MTAAGVPVFYSGSKLAPDLSLPRLQRRWATLSGAATHGVGGAEVLAAVGAARAALAAGSEDADGIAAAAEDLLAALTVTAADAAGSVGERWGTAAARFDRACRSPHGVVPFPGPAAGQLRRLARGMLAGRGRAVGDAVGGIALAVAVAALLSEIAAWQQARGRVHQAAAALAAAGEATQLVLTHPSRPAHRGTGRGTGRGNQRERGAVRPRGGSAQTRPRQIGEPAMTLLPPPAGPAAPRVDRS